MVVKEEIVEGLRAALARGQSLTKAMMSFYNAGYSKQDVEEASQALQYPQIQPQVQQPVQPTKIQPQVQQPVQPTPPAQFQEPQTAFQPIQQIQPTPFQNPVNIPQNVSQYGAKPKKFSVVVTIILVVFLVGLLGLLVGLFLFKDEIAGLFGNILSLLL